jgi:hypothetical protein
MSAKVEIEVLIHQQARQGGVAESISNTDENER